MAVPVKAEIQTEARPRVGAAHDPAERAADHLAAALTANEPVALSCAACAAGTTCTASRRTLRRSADRPTPAQAPAAATRVLAPAGSEMLGEESSMGIGVSVPRHALPLNAEEINYVTRVIAEGLAIPASSPPKTP